MPIAGTLTDNGTAVNAGDFISVNDILNGNLVFTAAASGSGTSYASFTFQVQDDGGTANGGIDTDPSPKTMTIDVTATNNLPGVQVVNDGATLVFSASNNNAISIADDAVGTSAVQVTLTATNGTLTLNGTNGLSFSFSDANGTGAGSGTNDTTMTFRGTISDINTALEGLVFTPSGVQLGVASVQIVTNDLGNAGVGGPLSATNVVSIVHPPVNTIPTAPSTDGGTPLVFSSSNSNAVGIADADVANVQVTLAATHGTLTLRGTTGLNFSFSDSNGTGAGDGTNDVTMTFRGTVAAINAALAGLIFTPDGHYASTASVQIVTNDLGNTVAGSALIADDTVTISISGIASGSGSGSDSGLTSGLGSGSDSGSMSGSTSGSGSGSDSGSTSSSTSGSGSGGDSGSTSPKTSESITVLREARGLNLLFHWHFRHNDRRKARPCSVSYEEFQVNSTVKKRLRNSKRRIDHRLRKRRWQEQRRRLFPDRNIHYDVAHKVRGGRFGGFGACLLLTKQLDLADAIDARLHLLKRHFPYFDSDHVLNLTYNILVGGTCLQDLELLRNDEHYLDALGAQRIPDPTTAGDFLRRFKDTDIATLQRLINEKRLLVWRQQSKAFFEHAILDADGTIVGTRGACKKGMDLSYKGIWGYHPLLISLANTQEVLFLLNRPASRPSHEGAAGYLDEAAALCQQAGFLKVSLRGDTDFSQTEHLDRWDSKDYRFVFGIDAMANLVALAQGLVATVWQRLNRPAKYVVKTQQRTRPTSFKEEVVRKKGYKNIRLVSEDVAEFSYRPVACKNNYRVVVLRKNLVVEKKGVKIEDQVRYFFYITNERDWSAAEVVYFANDRCNQENLIEQLKNGVKAMRLPVNTLEANWAYMVIGALAWSIKAWLALLQPRAEHRQTLLGMEFKKFLQVWMTLPCQIVESGRQFVFRLVSYNDWVPVLLATVDLLRKLCLT